MQQIAKQRELEHVQVKNNRSLSPIEEKSYLHKKLEDKYHSSIVLP